MKIDDVVNHFLIDCEIRGLSAETLSWYRKRLGVFVRKLEEVSHVTELEGVKVAHLRQFVQLLMNTKSGENNPRTPTLDKPLSAFTLRGYVRVIKVFFSWCVTEELIDANPSARLVQPKAPDYLVPTFTVEHIEKMLASCDTSTAEGFRNYVLLLVFLDTGMRVSELCGLRIEDVHDRYVKVLGKGRKEREIGLHPEVAKLLWKYIHKYRRPADLEETRVFIGRYGKPLQYDGVEGVLKRVKLACGIEDVRVSAHTFRHTFARFYLERGGEIFKLSREMGHSSVQVTEIYLKDYKSTEARREHVAYSPIQELNLKKSKGKKRQKDTEQ
ncbi:MAG TPA: tyrosine-type recombinase/integrase [Ktedonobacteraceae bacterium]